MGHQLGAIRSVWPTNCPQPELLSYDADPTDEMAALHAKLLICDNTSALVTSANFSLHGLHKNIEIGVKIESSTVRRLVEFFTSLIPAGLVKPIPW
jgi:phosphatidylserine/phosphatidylglycerophosphate/cardiolipin synthase-like enzyme